MNPNALALCLALLVGCGTVTADPHDAAGGAGGQLATGGQGGHAGDVAGAGGQLATGGAAGAPSSTGGAGGAPVPTCPQIGSLTTNGLAGTHCLVDCFGTSSGFFDGGASYVCLVPPTEAAQFTSAPGPIYCWEKDAPHGTGVPQIPAVCY